MYMSRGGELWTAGIDGTGVTALGTSWFLAEGATGTFFDTFVQIANPSPTPARIHVTFQLPSGAPPVQRDYDIPALQRLTIPVEQVDPALAATSVSIAITSTNGVPSWPSDRCGGRAATGTKGTPRSPPTPRARRGRSPTASAASPTTPAPTCWWRAAPARRATRCA